MLMLLKKGFIPLTQKSLSFFSRSYLGPSSFEYSFFPNFLDFHFLHADCGLVLNFDIYGYRFGKFLLLDTPYPMNNKWIPLSKTIEVTIIAMIIKICLKLIFQHL